MIKEALEFIAKIQTPQRPVIQDIHGQPYKVAADGTLGDPVKPFDSRAVRPTLAVATLSGLVAAYKAGVDRLGEKTAIIITDPCTVYLKDLDADDFGLRNVYVKAVHEEAKPFPFDTFLEPEQFLLAFRPGFLYNDNAVMIQQLCSTIGSATGVAVADDGVSQEVTVKSGTITKSTAQLPADGVSLIPNRIFRDAAPVEAKFLLRMKGVKDGLPKIALFEIDPNWRLYAVASIRHYFESQLPDAVIIA